MQGGLKLEIFDPYGGVSRGDSAEGMSAASISNVLLQQEFLFFYVTDMIYFGGFWAAFKDR